MGLFSSVNGLKTREAHTAAIQALADEQVDINQLHPEMATLNPIEANKEIKAGGCYQITIISKLVKQEKSLEPLRF